MHLISSSRITFPHYSALWSVRHKHRTHPADLGQSRTQKWPLMLMMLNSLLAKRGVWVICEGIKLTRNPLHDLLAIYLVRDVLLHAQIHQLVHGDHNCVYIFSFNLFCHLATMLSTHTHKRGLFSSTNCSISVTATFFGEHETPLISVNYANHVAKSLMCVGVNLITTGVKCLCGLF